MAQLSLESVFKSFGKTEVIHGIDCIIKDGEFVVILGPSGCGKSTLLRLVAGLEKVSSGTISIDGKVVNHMEPADRDVAMVFQNYALYPHMTVFKNMAYGLKIRGMAKKEIQERVENAANILELIDFLDRRPSQLSGGQRQRVAMGRCIVREPKLFLFDEPLSNLDAKLRVQMRLEIRKLHENLKITSIYVTHDQVEAMTLGDRLIVMDKGHAAQIGPPLDIYEKPASRFVAGFIGSPAMNFLDARITSRGRFVEPAPGVGLPLNGDISPALWDKPVVLGMRPEHIETAADENAGFRLTVAHVEILGADTLVYGHFGQDKIPLTLRLPDVCNFKKGAELPLSVPPEKLHLFDPETGRRIPAAPGPSA